MERLIGTLSGYRIPFGNERSMQDTMFEILMHAGIGFYREFYLGKDRVDFLLADGLAIECKVEGSPVAVMQQLLKYAACDEVKSILLVTSRHTHRWPGVTELNGKPFRVYWVAGKL
ncbi:MAG: hypothetical protein E6R03_14355 [Hyphomicrobiaceae bacterium]|nr:MAG: hypothetical protein E6R03_14355 [Hyphomicrobiaceae bacterium]